MPDARKRQTGQLLVTPCPAAVQHSGMGASSGLGWSRFLPPFWSVSGGGGAIEGLREAEPVQPGDLSLEIEFGIARVVAGQRGDNPIEIGEFLPDQLIRV